MMTHVHYGCGLTAPAEWVNFDSSFTLRFEKVPLLGRLYTKNAARFPANVRFGDITRGLPLPDGSVRGLYSSHVLEHLSLASFHRALENSKRLLAPGGIMRLVVPDLEHSVREYLRRVEEGDVRANSRFLEETFLGSEDSGGVVASFLNSLKTSRHLWMWDARSLEHALKDRGFQAVRFCRYGDCEDPLFRLVENPDRFERAVALEARR